MSGYIAADVLDMFINLSLSDPSHENIGFNVSYLKRCLKEMEITDAVKVVRCQDCEYLSNDRIAPEWYRICRKYGCGKADDGFCDEGERRE